MSDDCDGKCVLVTGGTSGIGVAIATEFAQAGATVTVTGLTKNEVDTFSVGDHPIAGRVLDVADETSVAELVGSFDGLDVLVNCAGTILRDQQEFDPELFARVVDVNLTGTMRMCVACRPLLADSQGCIVNTASMLTFFGSGLVPGYSASKGGVAQLTKSLAIAWADEGIRVNAVAPGWIETAFIQPLLDDDERSRSVLSRTSLGRWGHPEDVAGAVLFLCLKPAAFIIGVVLPVDGGYSIA